MEEFIMKAKSLHFSKSGSAQVIASELGRVYQSVCDQIPPAYPCEGEKVVFVGVEMNGKVPGPVERFCRDLTPARAQNVAFYVINGNGSTDGVKALCETMPTDADVQSALDWAEKIISSELK